jgi:hypothetical protein
MNRFVMSTMVALLGLAVPATDAFAHFGHDGGRLGGGRLRGIFRGGHGKRDRPVYRAGPGSAMPIMAGTASDDRTETPDEVMALNRRYLQLKNDTNETLTVSLQYRTENARDGSWSWYPVPPEQSDKAVVYTLSPGEVTYLDHKHWTISASRVRIWAMSESGAEWSAYKDEDLWLVPEMDESIDQHVYYAAKTETYTFTFSN